MTAMSFDAAVRLVVLMLKDAAMPGFEESAVRVAREYAGRIWGAEDGERVFNEAFTRSGLPEHLRELGRPN